MAATGTLGASVAPDDTSSAAPLRSVDWRFLLPVPPDTHFPHLAILGGPPGVLARAQLTGLTDSPTDALPAQASAYAVAAHGDAPYTITEIAASIRQGGLLYLEVDRERRGIRETTPARVEGELRAQGLTVLSMYVVEPALREARAFVSVDAPRAMGWHRGSTFGGTPAVRLGGVLRQAATRVAGRFGAVLHRSYSVVAVRAPAGPAVPWVLRDSELATLAGWSEPPASAVMRTYGGDRVILFPFASDGGEPLAVVKVPKLRSFIGRTENEHARARALRTSLDPALAAGIPEPLGVVALGNTVAAIERYVRGTTLAVLAGDVHRPVEAKLHDLSIAMTWLARFHRATEVRRVPWREAREDVLDDPIRAYSARHQLTEAETLLFRRAEADADAAGASAEVTLPVVCQHRDFAAWNILRDGDAVSIVDWEGAREGSAVHDALHLITTWLYAVYLGRDIDDEAGCVKELYLEGGQRSDEAAGAMRILDQYLRELGIDRRLVPLMVVSHRLELALRRSEQRRLLMEDAPSDTDTLPEIAVVRMLGRDAALLFQLGRPGW